MDTGHDTHQNENTLQELKNTLFLVGGVVSQLSNERDIISTSTSQMSFTAQQFQSYLTKMEELSAEIKKQIGETLHKESLKMSETIATQAGSIFNTQLNQIVKNLHQTTTRINEDFRTTSSKINFFSKWFSALSLCSALIGGLFASGLTYYICKGFFDRNEKIHSLKIEKLALAGEAFRLAFQSLDKKDQDKIMSHIKETIMKEKP